VNKVVLAIDSFKGCLSSAEVEQAAALGVKRAFSECKVLKIPIADGGEGMLNILMDTFKAQRMSLRAHDPLMRLIDTEYGISNDGVTALIEMAKISGLPLVSLDKRNPMLTTSYGMGEIIFDAINRGCRRFIIGIGGSATNDGGLGMLQALGFRFFDKDNKILGVGGQVMRKVDRVEIGDILSLIKKVHFIIACDVNNPLFGEKGAAFVFAAQKGATTDMIVDLDKGLRNLSDVIFRFTGRDVSNCSGAGAAGGMGAAFMGFLNAELQPGIEFLFDKISFDKLIEGADLIITGEGRIDKQTLMGKVPWGILKRAERQHIPVIAISGSVNDRELLKKSGFNDVFSINSSTVSLAQAMIPEYAFQQVEQTVFAICHRKANL